MQALLTYYLIWEMNLVCICSTHRHLSMSINSTFTQILRKFAPIRQDQKSARLTKIICVFIIMKVNISTISLTHQQQYLILLAKTKHK